MEVLDPSVVIDWRDPHLLAALPDEFAISAITAAQLAAGPHLASTPLEAARRQARVQEVESAVAPLPARARRSGYALCGRGRPSTMWR